MARTILVVDDEPTLRETLAEALDADGFHVVTAADGREALARFREHRPDLVVLDLMLPELSGIEVCRIIRQESGVPILMLTAKSSEVDKVLGLELGRRRLRDQAVQPARADRADPGAPAADRAGGGRGPGHRSTSGDLTVDLAGHRVLRDGAPVPLKPKVFELLAFLLRHPGQVFSREQLLEQVWGYDYAGETRTVDVHVHWLRAAIEPDPPSPTLIQTVRGVGYVFRRPA